MIMKGKMAFFLSMSHVMKLFMEFFFVLWMIILLISCDAIVGYLLNKQIMGIRTHEQFVEKIWTLARLFHLNTLEEIWGYSTILFVITCDYVLFVTTFATSYQLHQIWGGFATILQLMCDYYLLHSPMWMLIGLYSS